MKKLNITSQIFVIVMSILLVSSLVFAIITIASVKTIAENQVYSRLDSYARLLNSESLQPNKGDKNPLIPDEKENTKNDSPMEFNDMEVGFYLLRNGTSVSLGLDSYINTDGEFEEFISSKIDSSTSFKRLNGTKKTSVKRVYYVIEVMDEDNYSIIFTDTSYSDNLISTISLQLFIAFFVLIFLSVCVIIYWSRLFSKRVNKLRKHISDLPKNKYEVQYVDTRLDELGAISVSVDEMREEIYKNENTKQEMLQNLSHDFKTPIAVIKSYAEAIEDGVMGQEALSTIIEQSDALKHKVERLLQYNSLEYLSKDKPFEEVNMLEIVNEVKNQYKYLTKKDIEIIKEVESLSFNGYRENWYTVISNIVDNATRYAENIIRITIKENEIVLYNDGNHISNEFVEHSFKPYEKGDKGQFGLGMSIVEKTTNFFGYTLKVVNEEKGVSFIIK